ncbi:ArsR family transcriptional regulator [Roseibium hamelinense]|uniref:ArsR family transcriptional regulator n=1 Tax=Roseibium hamelinense TaxID=150831 RepID=A0A562TI85_9HYPH|nr:metalloregulator ArsR/SmtB family transcription factor [Roseibium hamelinense]MTI45844.1 ArsR family transcriptional regulator [Roseibium hamelinense]TWI92974.1 ArsR family transcriptional regulator [Roseibium hamelinense]
MENLDDTFAALAHGARRTILKELRSGEKSLSELAGSFDMSQTAVSKHVRILNEAGLVRVEQRGRTRFCQLNDDPMQTARQWITDYEAFWQNQFENLARHLAKDGL